MRKKIAVYAIFLIVIGIMISLASIIRMGIDFEEWSAMPLTKRTHTVSEDFDSIMIDTVESDIELRFSEGEECSVTLLECERLRSTVDVEDGTLKIGQDDKRRWYDYIRLHWHGANIIINIPKSMYDSVTINSVSGDIDICDAFEFESLEFNTVAGDVELENVVSDKMYIYTVAGDVEFDLCDAEKIEISTVSGDVTGSVLTDKIFSITTLSGDIDVPSSLGGGDCIVNTTSGDVKLRIKKAGVSEKNLRV